MKRQLKIAWARILCFFYITFIGMWRWECEFTLCDINGRIVGIIATKRIDMLAGVPADRKVFYEEEEEAI